MREGVLDLQLTHGAFFLSDMDTSDADDEGSSSSSEGAAAELSDEIFSSSSEESEIGLP